MSDELMALALSGGLIFTVVAALLSKKVSNSLISLFYSSLLLGIIFTVYGDALLGLLTMVTFAGAVSVLLLTVVLITGESDLRIGAGRAAVAIAGLAAAVGAMSLYVLFPGTQGYSGTSDSSLSVMAFAWTLRPWDLLILVVVFAASMVSIAGLLGKEE